MTISKFLVGGAVRDMLMGKDPEDRDYVVVGSTHGQMVVAGFSKVGADFPVYLHPETGDEYALARREKKTGTGYLGFTSEFSPDVTLADDLGRRDLTANSMAMDEDGNVVDPFNGAVDIKNKFYVTLQTLSKKTQFVFCDWLASVLASVQNGKLLPKLLL